MVQKISFILRKFRVIQHIIWDKSYIGWILRAIYCLGKSTYASQGLTFFYQRLERSPHLCFLPILTSISLSTRSRDGGSGSAITPQYLVEIEIKHFLERYSINCFPNFSNLLPALDTKKTVGKLSRLSVGMLCTTEVCQLCISTFFPPKITLLYYWDIQKSKLLFMGFLFR